MRKVTFTMSVSLDGFFEGPNREIGWHFVDNELLGHFNDWIRPSGAFLQGRITYELMASVWPTADQDPAVRPAVAEFARIWREIPTIVYSRTLERAVGNATLVREVVPAEIMRLKAQPGGDLLVGGADLAATFMRLDLIDEYRIYVHPIILGQGRALFRPSESALTLHLAETRAFGNGVVLLRYARVR